MTHSAFPVLTALIFFPLAASLGIVLLRHAKVIRIYTFGALLLELGLDLPLLGFDPTLGEFQFVQKVSWVKTWGLAYYVGLDGISLFMVALTVAIMPLCVLCSWRYIHQRIKEFHFCLLIMTTACVGVFAALDFVLFYVFWEAMLIPMYLLIAVWGGRSAATPRSSFFFTPWPAPPCCWWR